MSDLNGLTDEELVRRIRAGEDAAFGTLFSRYRRKLEARIAGRLSPGVRRRVGASDVLQEACLGAFERVDDFEDRGEGSFARWLDGIVEHKVRDAVRRHAGAAKRAAGHEVTGARRPVTGELASKGPSPSQVAVGAEFKEAVRAALDGLPPDDRRVLSLLREKGLTIDEAAAEMGRSREATKKLYGRALARLEGMLGLSAGRDDDGRRRPTR